MRAHGRRWVFGVVAIAVLVGCDQSAPPEMAGGEGDECGAGRLVASAEGEVCVFRRDQPLVIEGGFTCPASVEHRIDTATSIVCSARRLELLPPAVCAQIDGPCDASGPAGSANERGASEPLLSAASTSELGECIHACKDDADCSAGGPRASWSTCESGACVFIGCQDDAQCANRSDPPDQQSVCRPFSDGTRGCARPCETVADCGTGERIDAGLVDCIDGGCVTVGCQRDAQCGALRVCGAQPQGAAACTFLCETASDCAHAAQQEAGLDGPDPNDPFTTEDRFVCRHGVCSFRLGCRDDGECSRWFGAEDLVCRMSGS
jgi:hypothetical protein